MFRDMYFITLMSILLHYLDEIKYISYNNRDKELIDLCLENNL